MQAEGRRFDAGRLHQFRRDSTAEVQRSCKPMVGGSIPSPGTNVAHLAELADAPGSNPGAFRHAGSTPAVLTNY